MTRESMGERIHDYLDGRLGAGERGEFEARIASDPELARQVEFYRSIRSALRQDAPELPAGFLSRARSRFEAGHAPRPAWRHYVSWETIGLVTAGIVVLALLIPVGREEAPLTPELPAARDWKEPAAPRSDEAVRTAEPPPPRPVRGERGTQEKKDRRPAPLGQAAPSPAQAQDAPGLEPAPARMREDVAPAAAAPAAEPEPGVPMLESVRIQGARATVLPIRCQELPRASALEPALVEVVSFPNHARWLALLAGDARPALLRLAPDFRSERVVLLGPAHTALTCATVLAVSRPGGIAIQASGVRAAGETGGGLALVIPAGDSAVEVEADAGR